MMLRKLLKSPHINFLLQKRYLMSIQINNKLPETEEETSAMTNPYPVDKCPKK